MLIVDAHLDLGFNALRGRDITLPAISQPADDSGIASVGLPDLRAGGVGLICGTIFCEPAGRVDAEGKVPGYKNYAEAKQMALDQLAWYQKQFAAGQLKQVLTLADLPADGQPTRPTPAMILLLEGADPIVELSEVATWHAAGLRIVGLAWKQTRYAGGTGNPGPLTADGVALVKELDKFGIIHDISHLAEEAFWQLLDLSAGPIIATHSNCRALIPTDRQISDEMIKAIASRNGVVGMNFFDKFLVPHAETGRRATLQDVIRHIRHICDLLGNASHVAIGTDMDGGLGRDQIPQEIITSADLPKLADHLSKAGFSDQDVAGIMGLNWLNFFKTALPE